MPRAVHRASTWAASTRHHSVVSGLRAAGEQHLHPDFSQPRQHHLHMAAAGANAGAGAADAAGVFPGTRPHRLDSHQVHTSHCVRRSGLRSQALAATANGPTATADYAAAAASAAAAAADGTAAVPTVHIPAAAFTSAASNKQERAHARAWRESLLYRVGLGQMSLL